MDTCDLDKIECLSSNTARWRVTTITEDTGAICGFALSETILEYLETVGVSECCPPPPDCLPENVGQPVPVLRMSLRQHCCLETDSLGAEARYSISLLKKTKTRWRLDGVESGYYVWSEDLQEYLPVLESGCRSTTTDSTGLELFELIAAGAPGTWNNPFRFLRCEIDTSCDDGPGWYYVAYGFGPTGVTTCVDDPEIGRGLWLPESPTWHGPNPSPALQIFDGLTNTYTSEQKALLDALLTPLYQNYSGRVVSQIQLHPTSICDDTGGLGIRFVRVFNNVGETLPLARRTYTYDVYYCPRQCPPGYEWDGDGGCEPIGGCPPGTALQDGECVPFDPEDGIPEGIYNIRMYVDSLTTTTMSETVTSCGATPEYGPPSVSNVTENGLAIALSWDPASDPWPFNLVYESEIGQTGVTGCDGTVNILFLNVQEQRVWPTFVSQAVQYASGEQTGGNATSWISTKYSSTARYYARLLDPSTGETVREFDMGGFTLGDPNANVDNGISSGTCTLCIHTSLTLSLGVSIPVYRTRPDGTREIFTNVPLNVDLGTISLPDLCVPIDEDASSIPITILTELAEVGVQVAVDAAVAGTLTAVFPGWGALLSEFVNVEVNASTSVTCP